MLTVLRTAWPLLLGVLLLMVGNGMQGTLLGVRGGIESFSTGSMSIVMASYFGGFLLGSLTVPRMIQRVGHVRVFAALGSLISAILILYPAVPFWQVWVVLRLIIGFSFCGVYITAESWLNSSSANEARGRAMSAYMIVQMLGIVAGQGLMNFGDVAGYIPFVIPSVLVSLAFTPILLSRQPAPQFGTIRRMSFGRLWRVSPLGVVGIFLMGGVFSALFGMASVWGSEAGLSVAEITLFVSAIYLGGLLFQFPIGWLSDRTDRRMLVAVLSGWGALVVLVLMLVRPDIWGVMLAAALVGGAANPVYSLLLAYTNDRLDTGDMAAASAGLLFVNGVGSFMGPLTVGWLMAVVGLNGFWVFIGALLAVQAIYTAWRITRRETAQLSAGFNVISPGATTVAVGVALADNAVEVPAEGGDPQAPGPLDRAA